MKFKKLLLAAPVAAVLTACGSTSYQPSYQQVPVPIAPVTDVWTMCMDNYGHRALDIFCDTPHAGYYTDFYTGSHVILPAVGYAPVGPGWSRQRPNVTNITIHNHEPAGGGAMTAPPRPSQKSSPPSQAAKPAPTPTKKQVAPAAPASQNSNITRGGLGVKKK